MSNFTVYTKDGNDVWKDHEWSNRCNSLVIHFGKYPDDKEVAVYAEGYWLKVQMDDE